MKASLKENFKKYLINILPIKCLHITNGRLTFEPKVKRPHGITRHKSPSNHAHNLLNPRTAKQIFEGILQAQDQTTEIPFLLTISAKRFMQSPRENWPHMLEKGAYIRYWKWIVSAQRLQKNWNSTDLTKSCMGLVTAPKINLLIDEGVVTSKGVLSYPSSRVFSTKTVLNTCIYAPRLYLRACAVTITNYFRQKKVRQPNSLVLLSLHSLLLHGTYTGW